MVSCNVQYLRSASAVLKVAEVVSLSVTMGLFRGVPLTFGDSHDDGYITIGTDADFFAAGVMVAALLITPLIFIFSIITNSSLHHHQSLEVALNCLFAFFLLILGSVGMDFWHAPSYPWGSKKTEGLAMVVFCYISTAFYCADILVAGKNYCCKPKPSLESPA